MADPEEELEFTPFTHSAGGWTSIKEVIHSLGEAHIPLLGTRVLLKQNKVDGFACVSCSWAKPAEPHVAEFCEHGAKATAWELTTARCTPAFFATHTCTELESWSDHDLEMAGRLTAPLRYDPAIDRYVETTWAQAFTAIGDQLKTMPPKSVVFYASGRASLETSFMYGLMARLFGNNNLPDSSNMCHESTSVGLPESIGIPVGTGRLEDFDHCDCIVIVGHNIGTNAPRMLHDLADCRKRGVPIITFNPLREVGLERFTNPQSPAEMLSPGYIEMSTQYHQVRAGGDLAALTGVCKSLLAIDDAAQADGRDGPVDHAFIATHGHGYDEFAAHLRRVDWADIEEGSGLTRAALESAAQVIAGATCLMGVYGMGLTQHRQGVANVQMMANLLLMGGHFGRDGAGILPIRGHSNVQGQRTVGITEKPEQLPKDKLRELYGLEVPAEKGLNTVEVCEGLLKGEVQSIVCLGGNLLRAWPDTDRLEPAWREMPLSVQIATKLNRSHVLHGKAAWLLPCLGRTEFDRQGGVEQAVSMEDSTGAMHGSRGVAEPASELLLSEPAIVAGIAQALLPPNPRVPWDAWVGDYALVRKDIEQTYPEIFHDFESRMWTPGGFHRPCPPRELKWKTKNGKANFLFREPLEEDDDVRVWRSEGVLRLTTLRSFDQFNTTVYGYHDRFRGIHGTRRILMMNRADMARRGLVEGATVRATTVADDGDRVVAGLKVVPYDIPEGCVAGYYPELNPLVPLWHHAIGSKVPGYKSVPIRVAGD